MTRRRRRRTGRGDAMRLAALLAVGALCWAAPDRAEQAAHGVGTAVGTLAAATAEAAGPALAAFAERAREELVKWQTPEVAALVER